MATVVSGVSYGLYTLGKVSYENGHVSEPGT